MPIVPGLRSPYITVRNFVYFPRMLDKVRLNAKGQLHPDFINNLGKGFDDRCSQFLGINYQELTAWVLAHLEQSDEEVLAWAESRGRKLSTNDIEIWNSFMTKRGWRDEARETLERRLKENGLGSEAGVETIFDYIEVDEGRLPRRQAL